MRSSTAPNISAPDIIYARLGDVVTMPDGRTHTIRAASRLPSAIGSVAGFAVLGELNQLLTLPARWGEQFGVYVGQTSSPLTPASGPRQRAEGALRYWAPHLPAVTSAMGELLYRVVSVRGSIDPVIVVFRSGEPIYFTRAAQVDPYQIRVTPLQGAEDFGNARRESWIPLPASQPAEVPAPATAGLWESVFMKSGS